MNTVLTGGSSGLGKELLQPLTAFGSVYNLDRVNGYNVRSGYDVERFFSRLTEPVDLCINCAGENYLEWIENFDPVDFNDVMHTNCTGILNTATAMCKFGNKNGSTILNILSSAATNPMRTSIAYCASKAAAAMMTRVMARELFDKHKIVTFGVSPGKIFNTSMSRMVDAETPRLRGWTTEQYDAYNLRRQGSGKELNVHDVANFILNLLYRKCDAYNGIIFPYGAEGDVR